MKEVRKYPPLTRAEIDLAALANNYQELRRLAAPSAKMMAVVKADGYGHGAVRVSQIALENGADWLAVARISEVKQLREGGIEAPLLLFGICFPEYIAYLVENSVRASVSTLASAKSLSEKAGQLGVRLKIHIKVDTGMGRLGVATEEVRRTVQTVLDIEALPHLEVEGLYTHFACADTADKGSANMQLTLFKELLAELDRHNFEVLLRHAANSAATIELPESHLDLVRPGIAQYGLWPSGDTNRSLIDLKPVMSLKSRIIQLKEVPAGFKISYGSTYETPERTRIATVPVGYADGYPRLLSSRGVMLVRGVRVPVVGRVCMDLTMIDVGGVEGVESGDEVVWMGQQGTEKISAEELAASVQTINYEIATSITSRVERVYF